MGTTEETSLSLFTFLHWRRKCQPTPVFLPEESQGRGSLVGAIYGVAQSQTRLKQLSSSSSTNGKEFTCQCRRCKRCEFDPCVRKIPWRRARQPTAVFFLENPMDRGSLQDTVYRVTKSWTRLKQFSMHASTVHMKILFEIIVTGLSEQNKKSK